MSLILPDRICFRVSRCCNARCGFCLAPANGTIRDGDTLIHRLDWLMSRGVRSFDFCGGEPAIHPDLPRMLSHVHGQRRKSKITTNGIEMSSDLLSALRSTRTMVKVSLHGDRAYHNTMVGCDAFDTTTDNLRALLKIGVSTSIQTTVVAGGVWVVDWLINFCLETGVSRLGILPFLPRGNGRDLRDHYVLSTVQRSSLHNHVTARRRALNGRLDLRWLDLRSRPIPVVEVDGSIILEGPTEAGDRVLCRIPAPAVTEHLEIPRENDWS
jgi:sulfatase maturation enzyme AslB (radical SAM superfamily)